MLLLVAAALRDPSVSGGDEFWVREDNGRMSRRLVTRGGEARLLEDGVSETALISSIEKFRHGYWLEVPIPAETFEELGQYVGRFVPFSATRCRLEGAPRP